MAEWKHTKTLPYFCPYCGAPSEMLEFHYQPDCQNVKQYHVVCACCESMGPYDPDPEMAVKKFNTRCLDVNLKDLIDAVTVLLQEGKHPWDLWQARFAKMVAAYNRLPNIYKNTTHMCATNGGRK